MPCAAAYGGEGGDEDRGASKAMQAARVRPVSISVICNRHFCQIVEAF